MRADFRFDAGSVNKQNGSHAVTATIYSRRFDVTPSFPPAGIRAQPLLHCYPTLDHAGLEFSALLASGGLVAPAEFASRIGGIFPIALCGRSSL